LPFTHGNIDRKNNPINSKNKKYQTCGTIFTHPNLSEKSFPID